MIAGITYGGPKQPRAPAFPYSSGLPSVHEVTEPTTRTSACSASLAIHGNTRPQLFSLLASILRKRLQVRRQSRELGHVASVQNRAAR